MPLRAVADYAVSNVDKHTSEDEVPVRLCNYTDVYNHEFITPDMDFMRGTASESEITKFRLYAGDVVITKDSETWDDIGIPAYVKQSADDLVCGYHLAIVRPKEEACDGRFLFRSLQAKSVRVQLELAANGVTRFGIPQGEIGLMRLPVPSLSVQRAIADFLDRETARIDELIVAKRRLLEILAEKRRALISHAVTRGLEPNVRLKDSGIEWLDRIPVHWSMMKLKRVASMASGEALNTDEIAESGEYPVYGGNGLRGYASSYSHDGNHVLVGRQGALCGNVHIVSGSFWATEHAVVTQLRERHDFRWLGELLQVMNLNRYAESAAQPGLAVEFIANLSVPVPPPSEQRAIAAHIETETAKLDSLQGAAEKTIDLLKERRAALISAAVTGQIEVAAGTKSC